THVHVDVMGVSQADDDAAVQAAGGAPAAQPQAQTEPDQAASSPVVIIGDSITAGSAGAYTQAFEAAHIPVFIDGSSGRTLNGKGTDGNKLSGMEAIEQDKDQIAAAPAVVIALGTNGGNTDTSIDKAIEAIGSDKPVFWVDTIAVGRADDSVM